MKNAMPKALYIAAALVILFATGALAQSTVQMTITSGTAPNGTYGVMGGVYTSPYTGNINGGASIPIICDDFYDDVYPPQTWTALATNLAQLGAATTNLVYFDQNNVAQQQIEYMTAAVLAEAVLSGTLGTTSVGTTETVKGELSFALWGVFDPNMLLTNSANLTAAQLSAANGYVASALATVTNGISSNGLDAYLSTFSNVTIYSATTNGTTPMAAVGTKRPQEFLVVSMPEPAESVLLIVDLLAVVSLVCFVRRKQRGASLG